MLQLMKFAMILGRNMEYWWYIACVNLTNVEHDISHLPLLSLVFSWKIGISNKQFLFIKKMSIFGDIKTIEAWGVWLLTSKKIKN
jgi:hypothetical protein